MSTQCILTCFSCRALVFLLLSLLAQKKPVTNPETGRQDQKRGRPAGESKAKGLNKKRKLDETTDRAEDDITDYEDDLSSHVKPESIGDRV